MKKHILMLLLVLGILLLPLTAEVSAEETARGTCGDSLTWVLDDSGTLTVSGEGEMTGWTSASATPWYSYRDFITAVVLEDGVTSVGAYAFSGLTNLTSATLPSLSYIDSQAFYQCTGLEEVSLVHTYRLGRNAFNGCTSLAQIDLPSNLQTIEDYAFASCTSLTSVTLPNYLMTLGDQPFAYCTNLEQIQISSSNNYFSIDDRGILYDKTKDRLIEAPCALEGEFTIPDSVDTIDAHAFDSCWKLTGVTLNSSVTRLEASTFRECTALTDVHMGYTLTYIGDYCFAYCESLEDVSIGIDVTSVGNQAFLKCTGLKSVYVPSGVRSIGRHAFSGCTALEEISLPDSVKTLESSCFYNCCSLKSIKLPSGLTQILSDTFAGCASLESITLPDTVTSIGSFAFQQCFALEEIVIPDGVTSFQQGTFYCCTSLKKVTIPEGLLSIWYNAFQGCFALEELDLPESLTYIGEYAFHCCDSLTKVEIPESVQTIDNYAFYDCASLEEVSIPGQTYLDEKAFADCVSLKKLTLSENVTMFGSGYSGIFEGCSSLTSAGPTGSGCDFEYGWTETIPTDAFRGLNGLTQVIFPDNVTSIGDYAMQDCSALEVVEFPATVTSIGSCALKNCTSLTQVSLPENVTEVSTAMFLGCSSLTQIQLPAGTTDIGDSAFYGCSALETITIPAGVTYVGKWAFRDCAALSEIQFLGDAPTFGTRAFEAIHATAYYPAGNETWTDRVKTSYGGTITWLSNCGNHDMQDWAVYTEPSCGVEGEERRTCANCDCYISRPIEALEHEYTVTTKAPTCTTGGYDTHTCIYCGNVYKDNQVEALGHDYTDVVTAPTCTNQGYTTHICNRCNSTSIDSYTAALGHDCEVAAVYEPTCTTEGYTLHTCKRCSYSYKDAKVSALGHDWTEYVREADCYQAGYTYYVCDRCGAQEVDRDTYVEPLEHQLDEGVVTRQPTATSSGEMTYTCLLCGTKFHKTIPALGSGSGETEHVHTYGDWYVVVEPTTTSTGLEERACACGQTETRTIGALEICFTDVKAGAYYEDAVAWAVEEGITTGKTTTQFAPNDKCTRDQVVTFLWRAMGSPEPASTANPFVDVKSTDYFYQAVLWAVEEGITKGVDDTHFGPKQECTRAQVATFLWRTLGEESPTSDKNPFQDVTADKYYYDAVLWAVEREVTKGVTDTTFGPNQTCTRGQIVTFLYRALA